MEAFKFISGWLVVTAIFIGMISFIAAAISDGVLSDKLFAFGLEVLCARLIIALIADAGSLEGVS